MSFKKKMKKAFKNTIGDFDGLQWRDLDHKKVYMALGALILGLVLIVALIVNAVSGGKDKKDPNAQNNQTTQADQNTETPEVTETETKKEDVTPKVKELVEKYFKGLSTGDTAMVAETVDVLSDEQKKDIEGAKKYLEEYKDIACYIRPGVKENEYVVYVAYEMKFLNIETAAPGSFALYVCTADDGTLYIFNEDIDEQTATEEMKAILKHVEELAQTDEEVAGVITDVNARYQQKLAEDEDLKRLVELLEQSQQETPEEQPDAPSDENQGEVKELEEPVSTTVTDNVRLRKERSSDSEMLDTLAAGTGVKVYISYADGWSKVEYNGVTGYCKTEFLESTEGIPVENAGASEETQQPEQSQDQAEAPAENPDVTPVNKQMQFKEAVRIRAERSADSERLANAYEKELVMVIENYSDGWSKVEYNDVTGYCKTEFLEEAQ